MFIGFVGLEARSGKNDGDPAPGRSPGPPSLIGDIYSVESSHEAFQPAESPAALVLNQHRKIDEPPSKAFLSGFSSENVDYRNPESGNLNGNYNRQQRLIATAAADEADEANDTTNNHKLIIDSSASAGNENGNDMTMEMKKASQGHSSSNAALKAATSLQMKAQSRLAVASPTNSTTTSTSPSLSSSEHKSACNSGTADSSRLSSYLKRGDKVIELDFNYARTADSQQRQKTNTKATSTSSPTPTAAADSVARPKLRLDVTHDVFETSGGLLSSGIIYKGQLQSILNVHLPLVC